MIKLHSLSFPPHIVEFLSFHLLGLVQTTRMHETCSAGLLHEFPQHFVAPCALCLLGPWAWPRQPECMTHAQQGYRMHSFKIHAKQFCMRFCNILLHSMAFTFPPHIVEFLSFHLLGLVQTTRMHETCSAGQHQSQPRRI